MCHTDNNGQLCIRALVWALVWALAWEQHLWHKQWTLYVPQDCKPHHACSTMPLQPWWDPNPASSTYNQVHRHSISGTPQELLLLCETRCYHGTWHHPMCHTDSNGHSCSWSQTWFQADCGDARHCDGGETHCGGGGHHCGGDHHPPLIAQAGPPWHKQWILHGLQDCKLHHACSTMQPQPWWDPNAASGICNQVHRHSVSGTPQELLLPCGSRCFHGTRHHPMCHTDNNGQLCMQALVWALVWALALALVSALASALASAPAWE